ncbi:hypothetical protein SAMN04487851_11041 [Prevotella sp. tc2-28]|uniref:hypothetical protein n=1 Tax=Prevotella sp. tc2-28 TaxID=1761888 RepID=UPI000895DC1E|nr:hypothetical protein [Prevotella sp. tc2-28]SEA64896.1 hypothetical protein SAMN04487851_11041 [Prevotella sp. tc2-28]
MKKYFFTAATVALFAIGFAASDEETSSSNSSSESSVPQTEQKQETEAERQAREEKERAAKIKELEEKGYKAGYKAGFSATPAIYRTTDAKKQGKIYYSAGFSTPTSEEELELCNLFAEKYEEGFEAGYRAGQE